MAFIHTYIVAMMIISISGVAILATVDATIQNTGMNNPYALPDDHRTIDREYPTMTWCPDGPWTITGPTTLYLSMHDNSRFSNITYTINGNEYDLLSFSSSTLQIPIGYYEGTLYAEDIHGNYEDRYGYAINFTTATTIKIIMYYQEDQKSTYDCAGISSNSWFFQTAYASGGVTQFHEMTITSGNATEQLTQAQVELEKLRAELAILEAQLKLKAPDTTPFDQDDIDAAVTKANTAHQAELDALQTKHAQETTVIMTAVNQTLSIVTDVKQDVNRIIALCRQ